MKILLASNNAKKLAELRRIAEGSEVEATTPRELGIDLEPHEDGATFAANARIKALAFSAHTDLPVLADDSGLCVDALDGAPGVHSARYSGMHGDDAANRAKLLRELRDVAPAGRTARFVCALALARGGDLLAETEGSCEGRILDEERGSGGFGYDPLFLHEASGLTLAELPPEEKDGFSHRGRALRDMLPHLRALRG